MKLASVFCVTLAFSMASASADELPRILIVGEVASELAPHGKGNVYAPSVLIDGGKWKMWYGGQGKDGHDRIHYAESIDGQKWLKKGVVLEDRSANHINDPCVIKIDDQFRMYYTRADSFVVDRIYVATSTDGLKWDDSRIAVDVGDKGSWDSLSVGRPSVIWDGGRFVMWYDGRKDFPPGTPVKGVPISNDSHRFVGLATSRDGLTWQRQQHDPVFDHDAGAVDVLRTSQGYIMAYESHGGTRYAKSDDGFRWEDSGWLIQKSTEPVDRFGHVTPCLVNSNGSLLLYFGAAQAATWDQNCVAVINVKPVANLK